MISCFRNPQSGQVIVDSRTGGDICDGYYPGWAGTIKSIHGLVHRSRSIVLDFGQGRSYSIPRTERPMPDPAGKAPADQPGASVICDSTTDPLETQE